jgi:dienelactone hydrolase
MKYREEIERTVKTKEDYLDGIEKLILSRQGELRKVREDYCKDIFTNQEKYREDFKAMLGWPLTTAKTDTLPPVKTEKLATEDGYTVYRMSFEVLPSLTLSGLYFEMDGDERNPLVLVQHGGEGTPERISGFYNGNTSNYNKMLERVIANGTHAFAPQLLIWKHETFGVPYSRVRIDAKLKRVGSSIAAVELYGLQRIMDYFERRDNVSTFGMVGLSYGGFYTLFLSAIDTRIRAAVSCSFFNTRDIYTWPDFTWFSSASMFDDAEIAALTYPRKLCIEIGKQDALFDCAYGEKSFEKLKAMCHDVGTDWVRFITFDGRHEFSLDDEPISELVRELKKHE